MSSDDLIREQQEYYEQRAAEYEDVYHRRGIYDRGPEGNARWRRETAALEAALHAFDATGSVLELAGGTGLWTRFLVETAAELTVVDAAGATLELNRGRYAAPHVRYVHTDLFAWEPPDGARYDAIVFGFFVSHVPLDRDGWFWGRLREWLAPGGRVFLMDDRARPGSSSFGDAVEGSAEFAHRRQLADGREFTIVKRFFSPESLGTLLDGLGWDVEIGTTGEEFIYASATPRPGSG